MSLAPSTLLEQDRHHPGWVQVDLCPVPPKESQLITPISKHRVNTDVSEEFCVLLSILKVKLQNPSYILAIPTLKRIFFSI